MAQIHEVATSTARKRSGVRLFALTFFSALLLGALVLAIRAGMRPPRADPTNAQLVVRGRQVYSVQCAQCHGANLEGQPNWKEPRGDGSRPAPPHDATGHTWHHPDTLLFDIVKYGGKLYAFPNEVNNMPAFGDVLSNEEIAAVIAYIKSTWPPDIQRLQEEVNQQRQDGQ
jgi:mono/diheme cytochrome c family protein